MLSLFCGAALLQTADKILVDDGMCPNPLRLLGSFQGRWSDVGQQLVGGLAWASREAKKGTLKRACSYMTFTLDVSPFAPDQKKGTPQVTHKELTSDRISSIQRSPISGLPFSNGLQALKN